MREIKFRVWHSKERKMYFRGYQKLTHVLLCDDDRGKKDGNGIPVKRAGYQDCLLLECTDLQDKNGVEIYEGDLVRIHWNGKTIEGLVDSVPDMFKSRGLHPLHNLLQKQGIPDDAQDLEIFVLGNQYVNQWAKPYELKDE